MRFSLIKRTEDAERRLALYQHQTETHLKQERSKYQSIVDENELLNQQITKLNSQIRTYKSSMDQSDGINRVVERLTAD
jgi:uncharacterized protein YlxW (UPF0749 family)